MSPGDVRQGLEAVLAMVRRVEHREADSDSQLRPRGRHSVT